jgi:DNA processing protein
VISTEERLARALLTRIAEPGDELLGRLIDKEGAIGALDAIRSDSLPDTVPTGSGTAGADGADCAKGAARRFAAWRARLPDAEPERLLAECDALGGRLVCPGDAEWPSQLGDLGDRRPYALWVRGDQDLRFGCLRSVAIVGSRSATSYGINIAAEMGAELADRGWTVISGGAFGIDAAAHRGVLAADGLTVAVFACGFDVTYPSSHAGLFAEIARYGLLVSELPPGTPPTRGRFLVRNRTIAALTRGTVVVEAARRSGAISTARHARDLRRAVMVVPGPVTSAASAGCHVLLREWGEAVCVTDTAEVLDLVGLIGDDLAPERRGPVLDRDRLDPVTRDVLDAIPARGGAGTARIAVSAGVDLDTALASLGALSAAGFVERCAKGWKLRRRPPGS